MDIESTLPASSLIICSRNRPKMLFETVESILRGDDVPTEMIIVDQSTEPHPELTAMKTKRSCEIRYIHSKIVGVSAGRNLGICSARYTILIFIDDDMFVKPDWFSHLVRAVIKTGPYSVVTGQVVLGEAEVPGGKAPSINEEQQSTVYQGRIGKDVLFTGNMGAYRSVFHHVGFFDERLGPGTIFPAAEDSDLGYRLLELGHCICYVPEAIVYHRAWRSERESLLLEWRYGVGRGAYYAKHMNLRDAYMLIRMVYDLKASVMEFFRYILFRRRLRYDHFFSAFGLFYGLIRWSVAEIWKE